MNDPLSLHISLPKMSLPRRWFSGLLILTLICISIVAFLYFYSNGLSLAYNDARSHLNIGRRVVEGLKPGLAQLGSVWLPLTHLTMALTIWNDTMWHTGLAGSLQSMIAFVATGLVISKICHRLKVGKFGQLIAVAVFAFNLNILYLQSTAMTELPLLFTMTAGCYYLLRWHQEEGLVDLIKAAGWIMLATLIRYDGWFLLVVATGLVGLTTFKKHSLQTAEGATIIFGTLAALGIGLWFLWNLLIFKDPLYFAYGPFSAHAQQEQLLSAGELPTKNNPLLSAEVYTYAVLYNNYTIPVLFGLAGVAVLFLGRRLDTYTKLGTLALLSPLVFNIIALILGHSVLYMPDFSGNSWFNIRYGIMLTPTIAIFVGFLVHALKDRKWLAIAPVLVVLLLSFLNRDAVTIDDAKFGSSQKNVTEVAGFLHVHAKNEKEFILISAASHDAILFSSGIPMKRFIHEGTGAYWEAATTVPDRWARWIIMRTYDNADLTWKSVSKTEGFSKYDKVGQYPFADIYELKPEYRSQLNTKEVFQNQR